MLPSAVRLPYGLRGWTILSLGIFPEPYPLPRTKALQFPAYGFCRDRESGLRALGGSGESKHRHDKMYRIVPTRSLGVGHRP